MKVLISLRHLTIFVILNLIFGFGVQTANSDPVTIYPITLTAVSVDREFNPFLKQPAFGNADSRTGTLPSQSRRYQIRRHGNHIGFFCDARQNIKATQLAQFNAESPTELLHPNDHTLKNTKEDFLLEDNIEFSPVMKSAQSSKNGSSVVVAKTSSTAKDQDEHFPQKHSNSSQFVESQARIVERDRQIAFLEQRDGVNAVKIERQRLIAIMSILVAVISCTMGAVTFRNYQVQKVANIELRERKNLISSQAHSVEKLLEQKTLLVQEINHRIKNNLQIIVSLLNTQRRCVEPSATDLLSDIRSRVETMAIVQQSLNDLDKMNSLYTTPFISTLASRLIASSGKQISIVLDIDNVEISADTAAPLALIINELVCNALKHAFKGRSDGQIKFGLKPSSDGNYRLTCQDNGVGLPQDFDLKTLSSYGISIALSLAEQINGELTYERANPGTKWIVDFRALDINTVEQNEIISIDTGGSNGR